MGYLEWTTNEDTIKTSKVRPMVNPPVVDMMTKRD